VPDPEVVAEEADIEKMNDYQLEHRETFSIVQTQFSVVSAAEKDRLKAMISDYLSFRDDITAFLSDYFGDVCTRKCYESRLSACCSREGIIAFFADMAVNVLVSPDEEISLLLAVLRKPNTGFKCIYLGEKGCMWRIKPIVCEMFLCDTAEAEVFGKRPEGRALWEELKKHKQQYLWPDRPVLFDMLEQYFIDAGHSSPLMYFHNSPGLLRVKRSGK